MLIPSHLFGPEPFPKHYVRRDRLVQLFHDRRYARLIVVKAAAGYGKSVAVAEFTQQLSSLVVWYPLRKLEERTPISFIRNLVRAIQTAAPGFGRQIESLLQEAVHIELQVDDKTWLDRTILPALVSEIATWGDMWVILEDYHVVQSVELDRAFSYLVENAPDNVHLIVTLQPPPKWPRGPRWEGQEILASISAKDLAFTREEAWNLAQRVGDTLDIAQVEQIYCRIGGWPILHQLVYRSCQEQPPEAVTAMLNRLVESSSIVYEYLLEEWLLQQEPPVRDFLCRTAVLEQMDEETCNTLLGISNTGEILERLEEDPIFLTFTEPTPRWPAHYGLDGLADSLPSDTLPRSKTLVHRHEIVRDFLRQVLQRKYGTEQQKLYVRLARVYQERGEWEPAIASYCRGQEYDQASRLVARHAQSLISAADLDRLEAWLGHFPPDCLEQDPVLLAYRGVCLAHRGKDSAQECLERAHALFIEQGDTVQATWTRIELGGAHAARKENHQAIDVLEKTVLLPDAPAWLQIKRRDYMGEVLHELGRFVEAVRWYEEAADQLRRESSREGNILLSRLLRHLSRSYHAVGRSRDARRVLQEAYHLAQDLRLGKWSIAWISNLLAVVHQRLGDFPTAHTWLDEANRLLSGYREVGAESELFAYVLINRGHLFRDSYEYTRAEELYNRAGRGLPAHPDGVMLALRLVQPGYTQEALDLAKEKWGEYEKAEPSVARAAYEAMLGLAYLKRGDRDPAGVHLRQAEEVLEKCQAVFYLLPLRMYLAWLHFDLERPARGEFYLRRALLGMEEAGYYNLDWWLPEMVAKMCAQALRLDIMPDFVEQLALRRLKETHTGPFCSLLDDGRPTVRERAIRILAGLGDLRARAEAVLDARCKERDKETCARLRGWLDQGWLCAGGLLQLERILSLREIEILLLWISPALHGSGQEIARTLGVSRDTINTHQEHIKEKLCDAGWISSDLTGKGRYMELYNWAIRSGIVDPHKG